MRCGWQCAGDGALAIVDPLDQFVEGPAYFFRGKGAVSIAMDVLLDEVVGEAGDGYLLGVDGQG